MSPAAPPSPAPAPREARWAEPARWLVLALVGTWLLHPFATSRMIGSGDALWYANMLADFVTQLRAGVFPIFVGQTEYAFNGAVYPLRVAPFYQHLGGALDLLTGRHLDWFSLQHATVIVSGLAGLVVSYVTLKALAPAHKWSACLLAILYVSCPGALGTIYTQDLYMTWMTLPFVPLALYGTVRAFTHDDFWAQTWFATGLAGAWLTHAPIAMWLTFITGAIHLSRLIFLHRQLASWRRAALGALLLAALGHYPFVSLATLDTGGASAPFADWPRILESVRNTFPAVLQPVSPHAGALSDLQLGYALWFVLLLAVISVWRARSPALWALLISCVMLLVLLLPVPGLTTFLWTNIPGQIRRITFYWPMQRFYLLLAALLALVGQITFTRVRAQSIPWHRAIFISLVLACSWSLWESRQFIHAGTGRTASEEITHRVQRPENRLLMNHAYGLFAALPAYFSNGVMDPLSETRLLDLETLAPLANPTASEPNQPLTGVVDANPGVLILRPTLTLIPGQRYALTLTFAEHDYTGILQFSGRTFFREYILPESGEPRAFGSKPGNAHTLSLWTTATEPEKVTLRFIPTKAGTKPLDYARFAHFLLKPITPKNTSIHVTSFHPFRATVNPPKPAWLETPHMFLNSYAATAASQTAETRRSPSGLVMIKTSSSDRLVTLNYTAAPLLRFSYYASLATWLALLITAAVSGWLKIDHQSRPSLNPS